jgi:hypothetical protein
MAQTKRNEEEIKGEIMERVPKTGQTNMTGHLTKESRRNGTRTGTYQ